MSQQSVPDRGVYGPRSFTDAIVICLTGYVNFRGRAPRSEYWFFALFMLIVVLIGDIIDAVLFGAIGSVFGALANLALLLPSLAVLFRRLHDIDRTGWWWLLAFVPVVGWIVLLVFACTKGTEAPNHYGPDPLGTAATSAA